MSFHLKTTGMSSTDNALISKSHIYSYNMKYFTEMPSIRIFVCMKMFLTVMIKDEHTSNYLLQSDSFFLLSAAKSLKSSFLHAVYIRSSHCSVCLIICETVLKFSAIMYYY